MASKSFWKLLGQVCFIDLLWLCSNVFVHCELYTAMADFEEILIEERVTLDSVEQYIKRREAKLDVLRRFSHDSKKNQQEMEWDMRHPISMFHQISRLSAGFEHVKSIILDQMDAEDMITNISHHRARDGIQFPGKEDVSGAAFGLFRLQDTYDLNTHDIAEGRIPGAQRSPQLSAAQCFGLGLVAHEQKPPDYYHAMLWFQESYDRWKTEDDPAVTEEEILDYLSHSMYQQTNLERAAFLARKLKSMDPKYPNIEENLAYYIKKLKQQGIDIDALKEGELPPLRTNRDIGMEGRREFLEYESLCRGENNKRPTPDMKCYYKRNNPFLRLAPLKAEIMHLRPKLLVFRDIISPAESLLIRELGGPKIANYGIGGQYESHFDFAQKHEKTSFMGKGNRIATVLFYLSEPSAGGATIFARLNLTVYPTENDAVFWHNLAKRGDGDMNLIHAACPVLSGVKWVANKWLHEHGQEFIRPCALDEFEYE